MDDGFILNAPSIPLCLVNGHLKSLEDKIAACSNKTAKGQRIGVDGMVCYRLLSCYRVRVPHVTRFIRLSLVYFDDGIFLFEGMRKFS
jgi:hypothetical protein